MQDAGYRVQGVASWAQAGGRRLAAQVVSVQRFGAGHKGVSNVFKELEESQGDDVLDPMVVLTTSEHGPREGTGEVSGLKEAVRRRWGSAKLEPPACGTSAKPSSCIACMSAMYLPNGMPSGMPCCQAPPRVRAGRRCRGHQTWAMSMKCLVQAWEPLSRAGGRHVPGWWEERT